MLITDVLTLLKTRDPNNQKETENCVVTLGIISDVSAILAV